LMAIFVSSTCARARELVSPWRKLRCGFVPEIGWQSACARLRTCRAVNGERHAVKDYFPFGPMMQADSLMTAIVPL
jgi:hypothetical protein